MRQSTTMPALPVPDRTMWQFGQQIDHYTAQQMYAYAAEYGAGIRAIVNQGGGPDFEPTPDMNKKPTVRDCGGCEDDYYNDNNDLGVKRCWSLDSAVFVKALDVSVDLRPPYKHIPIVSRPNCYKASRYVRVKPESLDSKGFWK